MDAGILSTKEEHGGGDRQSLLRSVVIAIPHARQSRTFTFCGIFTT